MVLESIGALAKEVAVKAAEVAEKTAEEMAKIEAESLGAAQAGALTFAADVCRGKIARGGRAVALAGEDDGMAQRAVSGRRADLPGQCAVFR